MYICRIEVYFNSTKFLFEDKYDLNRFGTRNNEWKKKRKLTTMGNANDRDEVSEKSGKRAITTVSKQM